VTLPELFSKLPNLPDVSNTTLLTSFGVTGVFSTAYLASRASFKAARIVDSERERQKEELYPISSNLVPEFDLGFQEKVKLIWVLYIPAAVSGTTTITAIVMANHEASKKIAALTVASGISERAFQEYKAKVVEKLGENKAIDIRDEIAQDRVRADARSKEVIVVGTGNVLCFDMITGRYFESNMERIRKAENTVNHDILNHMYASLSSFYDEIGLPPTPYSDTVGWNSLREMVDVQYSTVMSVDDRPCIAIDFVTPPYPEYDRHW
jgi:hypothetical protein